MPQYEYKCRCCGNEFEVDQKITDEPLTDCKKCLVCALYRLIPNKTGFVLKGDSWAKDGYSSIKGNK